MRIPSLVHPEMWKLALMRATRKAKAKALRILAMQSKIDVRLMINPVMIRDRTAHAPTTSN